LIVLAYVKKCPCCGGKSYSSCKNGWKCPYCKKDLTEIEAKRAKN